MNRSYKLYKNMFFRAATNNIRSVTKRGYKRQFSLSLHVPLMYSLTFKSIWFVSKPPKLPTPHNKKAPTTERNYQRVRIQIPPFHKAKTLKRSGRQKWAWLRVAPALSARCRLNIFHVCRSERADTVNVRENGRSHLSGRGEVHIVIFKFLYYNCKTIH